MCRDLAGRSAASSTGDGWTASDGEVPFHGDSTCRSVAWVDVSQRFYVETLGCPKNQVDSDKLIGTLLADGMQATDDPGAADLVVVNTCAFIDEARRGEHRHDPRPRRTAPRWRGARRDRLHGRAVRRGAGGGAARGRPGRRFRRARHAQPQVDRRDGRAGPVARSAQLPRPPCDRAVGIREDRRGLRPDVRVLRDPELPRPAAQPRCGARSSTKSHQLEAREDRARRPGSRVLRQGSTGGQLGAGSIVPLVRAVPERADRVRLLYLYPSDLSDSLIDAIFDTGVPYFDLSLEHVSKPLLASDAALG